MNDRVGGFVVIVWPWQ